MPLRLKTTRTASATRKTKAYRKAISSVAMPPRLTRSEKVCNAASGMKKETQGKPSTAQKPDETKFSDMSGPSRRRLLAEIRRRRQAKSRLVDARMLKAYAPITAAARLAGVKTNSLRHAILKGYLRSYRLADDTEVVRLKDCQKLWPDGILRFRGFQVKLK